MHYWDNHGIGPSSLATVRVYACDSLLWEAADVELQPLDLWEVFTIDRPTVSVTPTPPDPASPLITPDVVPSWGDM